MLVQLHFSLLNNRNHRTAPGAGIPGGSMRKLQEQRCQQHPAQLSLGGERPLKPCSPHRHQGSPLAFLFPARAHWGGSKKRVPFRRTHGWVYQLSAPKNVKISYNSALFKNRKRIVLQRSRLQPNPPWYCIPTPWELSTSPANLAWICDSKIPACVLVNPLTQPMAFF